MEDMDSLVTPPRWKEFNIFGVLFVTLGLLLVAVMVWRGGWWWLAIWPAATLLIVGCGYLLIGSRVFGKTPAGTRRWFTRILLLPYCGVNYWGWRAMRLARRTEPAWHKVADGVYIGRRAFGHELPGDVDVVVDLTAEFCEPKCVRSGRRYIGLPTLDASCPDNDDAVFTALESIVHHPGGTYIHCAEGHGRAAMLTAIVLIAKGEAENTDDAIAMIKAIRPGIKPRPWQRARVKHWEKRWKNQSTVSSL